ncbi:MAG: hypothetical protein IJK26_02935 [Clostridia bacterium]|nr:hypothetical protein [Clostridia bacterium]
MKLSRNFTLEELTGTSYKELLADNIYYAMNNYDKLQSLAYFAQDVRDFLGVPMTVTSGVRCPALNNKLGGSAKSQHLTLEAIDFIPSKITLKEAFNRIKGSKLKFGQLIIEKSGKKEWIHISIGTKCETLRYDNGRYVII